MKTLIILVFFVTCYQVEPEIKGTYVTSGLMITFDNGNITGSTQCNDLLGSYIVMDNNISISIGGTKVFCEGEFNIQRLRNIDRFEVINNKLRLISSDEVISLVKK